MSYKLLLVYQSKFLLIKHLKIYFVNRDYKALRNNSQAWKQELAERARWESINDKLDDY